MSFIAHGLKCDSCEEKDAHVFYRKSDGPPPCPSCGGSRSVDWSHGKFPGVQGDGIGSFTPVDMGVLGYCETREDFQRAEAKIKERFPGHSIRIESDNAAKRQTLADEHRHRSWAQDKRGNLDRKISNEILRDSKKVKAEHRKHALSKNLNPKKVPHKHEVLTKNTLQLVGGN
jgi:hypothetical protein